MSMSTAHPGTEAIVSKNWLSAHRWLILRRISQLGVMALFLAGPWWGLWIVKGNLSSSLTLGILPLTDPYTLLQSWISGHAIAQTAALGAVIVTVFYFLVGGRSYCAWVCPVNLVTDLAAWLRRRLGLSRPSRMDRSARYWFLGMTLVVAATTGTIAWELVNPVSIMHRGVIFGFGAGALAIAGVFLFDLLVARRGWCGHLCPVGAFYSLLGRFSVIRVHAARRSQCNDCGDCYDVCPEPLVIKPALKGADDGGGTAILSPNCTNCGRCVDVCSLNVFRFGTRCSGTPGSETPPFQVGHSHERN